MIFLKKAFIISGVFISGLIGAGFATGSEILFYFSRYSRLGFFGIIISVFVFSIVLYAVTQRSKNLGTYTLDSYFSSIMNKYLSFFSTAISYLFMLIIFCAMLSGSGELLYNVFGIKKIYGTLIMLISSHLILLKGYKGFVSAQTAMSVFIILSILLFGTYILFFREQNITVFKPQINWIISSISYSSYNLLTACAILCILSKDSDRLTNKRAAILTFSILLPILAILWYIICIYNGMINLGTMPLLTIALRQSDLLGYFYFITIFISMLTTAVSNSYALIARINTFITKKFAHYSVLLTGFFLSGFDFEFIVDRLYRLVGILSVFVLLYIIKDFIKNYKKND